jgi:hypothetical protein
MSAGLYPQPACVNTRTDPFIGALTLTISNPPTQAQVQAILNAFNTLLLALKH